MINALIDHVKSLKEDRRAVEFVKNKIPSFVANKLPSYIDKTLHALGIQLVMNVAHHALKQNKPKQLALEWKEEQK